MNSIEDKLKALGLKQGEPVGKIMGSDVYFHKQYISDFLPKEEFLKLYSEIPKDFQFDVIKLNKKDKKISFISCEGFNTQSEPVIGKSFSVNYSKSIPRVYKTNPSKDNPLIFHHKWMFVKNNYSGFSSLKEKLRSLEWKNKLEKNKKLGINENNISSRIGRLNFWKEWCSDNKISYQLSTFPEPFRVYENIDIYEKLQGDSSAGTSINQRPATISFIDNKTNIDLSGKIILDIGCGRFKDNIKSEIENRGGQYFGCDPYNQPYEENKKAINSACNGKADIVSLNSVLNTINYKESLHIIENIMEQSKNAIKNNGLLIISIYEGIPTAEEAKHQQKTGIKIKLTPIKTPKGFQNRMKTEMYMDTISKYFPNIIRKGHIIVASQDESLDLNLLTNTKNKKKLKGSR